MATKISFVSLGCDKNLIDSEIMLGLIDEKGYIITPNDSEADVIIINSCGFILDANQEAIDKKGYLTKVHGGAIVNNTNIHTQDEKVINKLQAVIDAGEEYQTYSAIADGQTGSVKFIYKLASIDAKADSDK